ncbi:MAG: right-handed parallel beta-helix repeat-containing protein [archaeon]
MVVVIRMVEVGYSKRATLSLVVVVFVLMAMSLASAADIYVCNSPLVCPYNASNFTSALVNSNSTDNTIIINQSGVYTLNQTANFNITDVGGNGTIFILKDDIILDCDNSVFNQIVYAPGSQGIYTNSSDNVTIKRCGIINYMVAYSVYNSTNVTINDSFASGGLGEGIILSDVRDVQVNNVNVSNFDMEGISLSNCDGSEFNNIITNDSYAGFYLTSDSDNNFFSAVKVYSSGTRGFFIGTGSDNNVIDSSLINSSLTNGIEIVNSANNIVNNTNVTDSANNAVYLNGADTSTFSNDIMTNSTLRGFFIVGSDGNNFSDCKVLRSGSHGFHLFSGSNNNNVLRAYINDSGRDYVTSHGLVIETSAGNTINDTNISFSNIGVVFNSSNYTSFNNNIVYESMFKGIYVGGGHNNSIAESSIFDSEEEGIYIVSSRSNNILNSAVNVSGSDGIRLSESVSITVNGTNISSSLARGIYLNNTNSSSFNNNILQNSVGGLYVFNGNSNVFKGQNIIGIDGYGFYLWFARDNFISSSSVNGTSSGHSIFLRDSANITVNATNTTNSSASGLFMLNVSRSFFANNLFMNTSGIYIADSTYNNFVGNNLSDGKLDWVVLNLLDCMQNFSGIGNIMGGMPIVTYMNDHDKSFSADVAFIGILNSSNITLSDFTVSGIDTNWGRGIRLCNASGSTIYNVSVTGGPDVGIDMMQSNSNTISRCIINNTDNNSVYLVDSDSNTFSGNIIRSSAYYGMFLNLSENNVINASNNFSLNSMGGIYLTDSNNTAIRNNSFIWTGFAVYVYRSFNATIEDSFFNASADGVILQYADNCSIRNNNLSLNSYGFNLVSTYNCRISNNIVHGGSQYGLSFFNSNGSTIVNNSIKFNADGLILQGSSTTNNISYNDIYDNTNYDLINSQDINITAENNYWGSTWAYFIDNASIQDDEDATPAGYAVDFCPLLNDTFASGASVACEYPAVSLSATAFVSAQNFTASGLAYDLNFSNCTYRIEKSDNASMRWLNGSFNSTLSFSTLCQGLYLPMGTWNLSALCYDIYNHNYTNTTQISSVPAIVPTIVGAAYATGTIGGSEIIFTFTMMSKGYPFIRFFMNLTSGVNIYDISYAKIGNDTARLNISNSFTYANAQTFNMSLFSASEMPQYNMYSQIYAGNVSLFITPYTGLSAGAYSGSYGWGLFDTP